MNMFLRKKCQEKSNFLGNIRALFSCESYLPSSSAVTKLNGKRFCVGVNYNIL